ncbi:MAG: glycosyltransferase family 2 protein [Pirellulales bacterium]|nr:glycosyltransferase family 2 protein [Pirellulales bacterium]
MHDGYADPVVRPVGSPIPAGSSRAAVSVVVPVYHNANSLHELLNRLQAVADRNPEHFEFVFVDDGSRDRSFEVLQDLLRRDDRVRVVKLTRNFGASAACTAGLSLATGDAMVAVSADLQDPPEIIDQMLARWRAGYRLVLASRTERHDPWLTKLTSRLYWKLFRRYAIPNMPEQGSDYCLLDRQVMEALRDTHEPSGGVATLVWTGFQPAIIEYERQARAAHHGRSSWTFGMRIKYMIDSFVAFSHVPIRAASMLGISLAFVGVCYAVLVLFAYAVVGVPVAEPGWASLMVVLLVVSGVQLIMTGIFGEYLVRTLEAARRRPTFIIDRVLTPENVPHLDAGGDVPHPDERAGGASSFSTQPSTEESEP